MSRKAGHATICLMNTPDFAASALEKARERLLAPTPLARDCGRLCGAACCRADEQGRGGMLLFPGEEALYRQRMPEGFAITRDDGVLPGGRLLTCSGLCRREDRPLACRLFPLAVFLDGAGEPEISLDPRAWPLCPLMPSGMAGLSAGFVEAARDAARMLAELPEIRAFLAAQSAFLRRLQQPLWKDGVAS